MKNPFRKGDIKHYEKVVGTDDVAAFESGVVHPVYSTFALARDAEWACRLFVLEMKDEDEEGIGTMITVNHLLPAAVNSKVLFEATLQEVKGNEIICTYRATCNERLIAEGEQRQKILKKEKLQKLFSSL